MRLAPAIFALVIACGPATTAASPSPAASTIRGGCRPETNAQRSDTDVTIGPHIPLPTGAGPVDIAVGADGASVWFSDNSGGRIGHLTKAGHLTLWAVAGSAPSFLVVDGADVWVPDQNGGAILRVTGDAVMRCLLPSAASTPFSIAKGTDGAMWIAENAANAIARMTRDGAVIEYKVPAIASGPVAIVLGPDGNMWFTEERGGAIGRVTPNGDITTFPLPDKAQGVGRIIAGPDKALWFVEYNAGKIGRITTDGTIRIFDAVAGANGITVVNGAFYVTGSMANALVRIEVDGKVTPVTTTGAFPDGLVGLGGQLWIVEYRAGDIFITAP